ncbi:MAG: class I SAM-dependent RNA methyltransferase, partial [Clostridia bacterium]|nr:class I SAM-dependent RNA methyltransferase [Clostridia bacterium]
MLKQNDKITYTATGYANAETVGEVDGYTVFVGGMIVGETATVKVTYVKKKVAYADVVEILTPSPMRVNPPCRHFGKCGGCTLMHMDYAEQLKFKQNKVASNFKKLAKLDVDVLPCVPSNLVFGYRNKLSLPVAGRVGNAKIGMYQRGSHVVVNMDDCLLGGSWSTKLTQIFRDYLNQNNIPPYNEKTFTGVVCHLVARYVDEQLLVTIVSNGEFNFDLKPLVEQLKKVFPTFGLFVNVNTYKNNVILGKITRHVYGISQIMGE